MHDQVIDAIVGSAMGLPDILSLYRIVITPVVVILILAFWPEAGFWIAALTGTVWISDAIDGTLARRYGLGSDLGPSIDWLGDKLFTLSVLIALTSIGQVPAWVTILFVAREIVIMQLRYYCLGRGVTVKSRLLGRVKMGAIMLAIIAIGLSTAWSGLVLYLALVAAYLSALDYSILAFRSLGSQN